MKKVLLLAAAAMLTATAASAQFKMGVKAGANMANLTNTSGTNIEVSPRFGLTGGVFAEYSLCEKFALSADVLYSQQGNVVKVNNIKGKSVYKTDYLNIPILANYYFFEGFAVKAGVQPGMLLSAKVKTSDFEVKELNGTEDVKKQAEKLDLSIPVGLSYELPMGLQFDARYAIGMTKVNKEKVAGEKNSKNSVFSLTVGYKF